jgi:two-component system response regulator HydG
VEPSALSSEAMKALRTYTWPGNVRELQNVIERGAILAENGRISADVLPLKVLRPPTPSASETGVLPLRESERLQILRALRETRWNKSQAAGLLGITRKTLDRKIKEYDLDQSMTRKVQ